ncbi:MAG: tyrosine-type recombinase/integrase [Amaricoccus sp.]
MRALTELAVQKVRPPATGRVEVRDSLAPGLVLRVTANGVKTWSVIYKVPGEGGVAPTGRLLKGPQRRVTLGTWPAMSLSAARDAAVGTMRAAANGTDPRRVRQHSGSSSVAAVAGSMVEQAKTSVSSWANMERVLKLHVTPTLGHRPIGDVTWADIRVLLDGLMAGGKAGTAREVRKHLSRLFSYAADRGLVAAHPMAGRRATDLQREEAGRALSLVEARATFWAASGLGYPFGPLFQLLLLTGARRSEWGEASWSEVQGSSLVIPRSRFKSRRDHVVPLGVAAMLVLATVPRWTGPYVFSTDGGKTPVSGWSRAKRRMDEASGVPDFRIHDLRVTVATSLAERGIPREVVEAVLGHAQPGLVQTYTKHQFLDERRAALMLWEDALLG